MKARPILFQAEMVRALLDGSKTQTRRIIKPHKGEEIDPSGIYVYHPGDIELARCPYGKPGDLLWVRESFLYRMNKEAVVYRAAIDTVSGAGLGAMYGGWKPSIHMPKWASRLTLEITDVRIEQLRAINERDAKAEGTEALFYQTMADDKNVSHCGHSYAMGYRKLWISINGEGSWLDNPWVYVIEFKTHLKNIGEFDNG